MNTGFSDLPTRQVLPRQQRRGGVDPLCISRLERFLNCRNKRYCCVSENGEKENQRKRFFIYLNYVLFCFNLKIADFNIPALFRKYCSDVTKTPMP